MAVAGLLEPFGKRMALNRPEAVAVAQEPPALVLIPGMKMGVGPGRELETVQEAVNPATI